MWHNRRLRRVGHFVLATIVCCQAGAQISFREACAAGDERAATEAALRNPTLALQQFELAAQLPFAGWLLDRLAVVAPDQAMMLAPRAALQAGAARSRALAELAADTRHDLPTRRRAAFLTADAHGDALWKLAAGGPQYYSALVDFRESAAAAGHADETAGYDRALEAESVTICRAAAESGNRTLASDLGGLRGTDVYLALAYGGAECLPDVFPAAFDRFLAPRLKTRALAPFLERTHNWKLFAFTDAALLTTRFNGLLALAGPEALANLATGIDDIDKAVEVAEIIGASKSGDLTRLIAQNIAAECARAADRNAAAWYGLLAARLLRARVETPELRQAGARYVPLLAGSDSIDTRILFDSGNRCIERYFFWDDDDGVQSFENFLRQYDRDAAWKIERLAAYVHLVGRGAGGRTVEIYANIPIDIRQPRNREREGEALRRQAEISVELARRGLDPPVLVQRGHVYHVEKTLAFVTPAAKLVMLGSCRGVPEIHHVIETSHGAQVIATRGVGATQINDAILKGLNVRLLSGEGVIRWADFWREQQARAGKSAVFEKYLTPDRDEAAAFLRAWHLALDAGQ